MKVLDIYCKQHRLLAGATLKGVRGWMIPFVTRREDLQAGRGKIPLVGDSANLVDPLLGEGIYYALLSGKLCAESLVEDTLDPVRAYKKKLEEFVIPELIYAGKIASLAYRFQRIAYRMGGGYSLDRFFELLEGKRSYRELYRRGLPEFVISLLHIENFLHIIIDKILRRR